MRITSLIIILLSAVNICATNKTTLKNLAQRGNSEAQCELGLEYFNNGDLESAKIWFEKSAASGNITAIYNLGMYWDIIACDCIEGCAEYYEKAYNYFKKAANEGLPEAQYMLADYSLNGFNGEEDIETAKYWYKKAAEQGFHKAKYRLATITLNQTERYNLLKECYNIGIIDAEIPLALCYLHEEGTQRNVSEAIRLLNRSADRGRDKALFILGKLYALGEYVTKDKTIANSYFNKIPSLNLSVVEEGVLKIPDTNRKADPPFNKESININTFKIARYPITVDLFEAVMDVTLKDKYTLLKPSFPVNCKYDDMKAFISMLNQVTGRSFYLPSIEEWTYAATGGRQSSNFKYCGSNNKQDVSWNDDKIHPIGQKKANELGLYGMAETFEWTNTIAPPYPDDIIARLPHLGQQVYYGVGDGRDLYAISYFEKMLSCAFRIAESATNTPDPSNQTVVTASGSVTRHRTIIYECINNCR